MGTDTKIAWAAHTLNFWMGCSPVSEACQNCYAKSFWRRMGMESGERRRVSNRTIQATLRKAKAGDHIFVNSLSDFFDGWVDWEWRAEAWDVMRGRPDLVFLLLTKRVEKMADYIAGLAAMAVSGSPHIWLGVTAENQQRAEERIPKLLGIDWPGKKFVSIEPMLGPVDLQIPWGQGVGDLILDEGRGRLDWVIVGGESGPNRRTLEGGRVRSVRDQCIEARVPFFFKGWVGNGRQAWNHILDGRRWEEKP